MREAAGNLTYFVRKANQADRAAFREFRLEALRLEPTAFSADYGANLAHPAEHWEGRLRELDDTTRMIFFAQQGQALAGMAGIVRGTSPKTIHSGMVWGVYVRPPTRGQGMGESLIRACLGWARERRLRVVKLAVVVTNLPAIRCYQRCGFTLYGVEPQAIIVDGKAYDELLMAVQL